MWVKCSQDWQCQASSGLRSLSTGIQVIRGLLTPKTYVIVVEHDLAVLDYLSDFICCLYGKPGTAFWAFASVGCEAVETSFALMLYQLLLYSGAAPIQVLPQK